jgi:hypothetical protein
LLADGIVTLPRMAVLISSAAGRILQGLLLLAIAAAIPSGAAGQTAPPVADVRAVRTMRPPVVDGRLNDEVWALAPPAASFTQRDPDEGKAPTERTEIRFLYDNDALYIGARLHDSEPGLVSRRLARRDDSADADVLSIYLDPMHDHLTGAVFRVSAANVQQDATLYNDSWTDGSWDAVWDSAVTVDEAGWAVEMRIHLSQLRFPFAEAHTWGVNVERYIRRKNERDWLLMVPKNESGLASRMLHLTGLDGIRPKRMFELLPYTAARSEHIAPTRAGNPFNDGSRAFADAGVDVKWGLSSNLTLNGTINPDFGQVEVDPAVVNLTAFETFFEEKRPFFLEGSQIFGNFGSGGSNNFWGFNTSDPSIFYSRRIGRAPQLSASGDFVDPPAATTILGAAKLTGKTGGGWSIGILEALTDRETARTHAGGSDGRAAVEPFTNYFVARVQRELGRRVGAGFMATSVTRRLDTGSFRDALGEQASVYGADGYVFLDNSRNWVLTGKVSTSRVSGSAAYVQRLQRAPQRYYQRPDAAHVELDATRTALTGISHRLLLNRNSGSWFVNAQIWGVSPGFESNDLGFHSTGDRGGAHAVFFWRNPNTSRWLRYRQLWVAKWWTWNYAREPQGDGFNIQGGLTFLNYWNLNAQSGWRGRVLDDRLTRGGVSAEAPGGGFWNVNGGTDSRLPFSLSANANYNWNAAGGWSRNAGISFNIKPSTMVTISTGPSWNQNRNLAQYVRTVSDAAATGTYGERYVFGLLDQAQLTLTTRASLILSPKVSLQVFMQPLLAVGDYSDFKELAAARTFAFLHYGAVGGALSLDEASRRYTVDPDGGAGGAPSFTFNDPDFNVKSLRLNAVFRWELRPGSTFYAVWTRQQQDLSNPGTFVPGRDATAMFRAPGDDVVLVKMAYWIGR